MTELLLGCGHSRVKRMGLPGQPTEFQDLVTCDNNKSCEPDFLGDLNQEYWDFFHDVGTNSNLFTEIHAYEVLEHLGQQGDMHSFFSTFANIWRLLVPDGYLFATVPSRYSDWLWGDPGHTRYSSLHIDVFTSAELRTMRQNHHVGLSEYLARRFRDYSFSRRQNVPFLCIASHQTREKKMIPREKILVAIPSHDSKVDFGCVMGLMMCLQYYHRPLLLGGCSNIQLARSIIAHRFVETETQYDWLMMIDSDIQFTEDDWAAVWEGDEKMVIAPYARKQLGEPSNTYGLGFARVHRSVFEKIKELKSETGEPLARQFMHKGMLMTDYFPQGAIGSGGFVGEDQGFLMWCARVEDSIRWETRTRLTHIGRFEYGYPDQIPGWKLQEEPPTQ
jgi:hypothetical protein